MLDPNIIKSEINKKGFYIIDNYLDDTSCDNLVDFIKNDKTNKLNFTKMGTKELLFAGGGDFRSMVFHEFHPTAQKFLDDEMIHNIFEEIVGEKIWQKRCQAGVVKCVDEENNSGGTWHVDSYSLQLKALVYLNDVDTHNGPFMYISDTWNISSSLPNPKNDISKSCFENSVIKNHPLMKDKKKRVITGKKGTCILFRTDNIHTVDEGCRYSLTNYYYFK